MAQGLVSKAEVEIHADSSAVWNALTNPEIIKQYMYGAEVISDWKVGSSIVWKGEYQGKKYEDKGEILKLEPERLLEYSHFSPLGGEPDVPENYHTITIEVKPAGENTSVSLSQDNNKNDEEVSHTAKTWQGMLDGLKNVIEK